MKSEFYLIYQSLYYEYGYAHDFGPSRPDFYFISSIRDSIESSPKGGYLRPDAKYFLLINFHHLIIKPLFEQRQYPKASYPSIEFDIKEDIAMIVSESYNEAEGFEISGHQVMRTIDRVWTSLFTTRIDLWG